jgi:hypothetical protein
MGFYSGESYDPTWLVDLAKEQYPDWPELATALSVCTTAVFYCCEDCQQKKAPHFIDPHSPKWKFKSCIRLESDMGTLVLDLLEDGSIGSLEYLDFFLDDMVVLEVD